ncbi:vacuolar segregation subunit 7-domain-containing protein [Coniochaeta sp. 2T2.1]|nr:vacuolar segregation subunit 7-domain-containing protein [Coniochaeta sp. 2T2.1]
MGDASADANANPNPRPSNPTLSRESTTGTVSPRTESWPSTNQGISQPSQPLQPSQISQSSAASSATPSPLASREPSPQRPHRSTVPRPQGTRSRKNSQQDTSPARSNRSTGPTSAPSTKSLSASTTPSLPAPNNSSSNVSMPQKLSSTIVETLKETPRWPVSPRLRSPPPILNKPVLAPGRRLENEAPVISVQRPTPTSNPELLVDVDSDDSHLQPGSKTPTGRSVGSTSTLETVQEVSPLASPQHSVENAFENLGDSVASEASSQHDSADGQASSCTEKPKLAPSESGSEAGSIMLERRSASAAALPPLSSRQSSTSTLKPPVKGKTGEGTSQSMTVETETVTSIPQVALAQGAGVQGSAGSIRTKPSSETIRPKKDKKKPPRKQPAVTSGTASSKADIFEAKVASAVEEANSSDSEETFVYDSNPPDGRDRPHRFHSRTPSATSMMSQVDRNGMRSIPGVLETAAPTAGFKKSMKFVNVNTFTSNPNDGNLMDEDGKGTGRSTAGSARGTARHHHHLAGRYGRNGGGNGHPSIFADESPFVPGTARSGVMANTSRQSSRPSSPRFNYGRSAGNSRRGPISAGFDLDNNAPVDDEMTPLLQSPMRSTRSARRGRLPVPLRGLEPRTYHQPGSFLNRFASCLVLTVMLLLVISGAIGFMFATSQPLTEIELTGMRNVLASEQEVMLDITVRAHNPNVVVVVIDSADIEVFAKSKHAGTDSEWWRHPHDTGEFMARRQKRQQSEIGALDDPINDPPRDDRAPNMRLGTIREFDSPLSFEGSFFHRGVSSSTGEIRLHRPGNGTDGGAERWERIMQDEFDLILKGVLKYSLPLSQRIRSVAISGRKTIKPNSANDPTLKPNSTAEFDINFM